MRSGTCCGMSCRRDAVGSGRRCGRESSRWGSTPRPRSACRDSASKEARHRGGYHPAHRNRHNQLQEDERKERGEGRVTYVCEEERRHGEHPLTPLSFADAETALGLDLDRTQRIGSGKPHHDCGCICTSVRRRTTASEYMKRRTGQA